MIRKRKNKAIRSSRRRNIAFNIEKCRPLLKQIQKWCCLECSFEMRNSAGEVVKCNITNVSKHITKCHFAVMKGDVFKPLI